MQTAADLKSIIEDEMGRKLGKTAELSLAQSNAQETIHTLFLENQALKKKVADLLRERQHVDRRTSDMRSTLAEQADTIRMRRDLIELLVFGESDPFTLTMTCVVMRFQCPAETRERLGIGNVPKTRQDFEICVRFLKKFPQYKQLILNRLPVLFPQWKKIVENWDTLEEKLGTLP